MTDTATAGSRVRRLLLRTAFLLTGAAICVAFLLLQTGAVQVARQETGLPTGLVVPVVALPVFLLGLVPGVREVEVAAARSLLGVRAELVVPASPTGGHRWRSAVWVALHILLGGLVGVALVVALPSAFTALAGLLRGERPEPSSLLGGLTVPAGALGFLVVALALAVLAALVMLSGTLMARWAPAFLGPTWQDRLQVAEDRLSREAEHQRLARELHDGIGHALSVISLQAAAGGRVIAADAERAAGSLHVIEETARAAMEELDEVLAALRDGPTPRRTEPGLADLDQLVATHRALGLEVTADVDPGLASLRLPALVSRTVHQVAAEALTNAARHAAPGPVAVAVRLVGQTASERRVQVRVTSVQGPTVRSGPRGGRGLRGIGERVALLGGSTEAGPDGRGHWVLDASVPLVEVR